MSTSAMIAPMLTEHRERGLRHYSPFEIINSPAELSRAG